jgi:adenosylmethionine-8-amino-7-oxononanoate aminotransferase
VNPPQPTLDQLAHWDSHHHWHAFTQMQGYQPLVIERGEGSWLVTADGRRLIDGASSMWCNVFGHAHPRLNGAIARQLDKMAHCTSLGMGNTTTIRLAKRLADAAPGGLEHVFFGSDGSSAIEVALKMAFQYWRQCPQPRPQKTKYLSFGAAYHGDTLGAAAVGGIGKFHELFRPILMDTIQVPSPDPRPLAHLSESEQAAALLKPIEQVLREHADTLAAVVIEPLVQCAAGMVMQPAGFLRGLAELARAHDVLLIADEVAVGCGKTGRMFACEHEQVVPDFLCLGKGITSGYLPLSATITHNCIWQAFLGDRHSGRALYHGHTFSGNPAAAAVALEVLDMFAELGTLAGVAEREAIVADWLQTVAAAHNILHPRTRGIIAAFELAAYDAEHEVPIGYRLAQAALDRGVWLRPRPDQVYLMPPLAIRLDDLQFMLDAIAAALDEVLA